MTPEGGFMIEGYYIANPTTPEARIQNRLVMVLERAIFHCDLTPAEAHDVITDYRDCAPGLGQTAASQQLDLEPVLTPEELEAEQMLLSLQKINHPRKIVCVSRSK
ncbi:MAG TPA: hypothetical protein VM124_01890 [Candidatus Limnocylindrales bacterium]|nr:hypothetical protein [Candidatus Limnocylindrales bacterium]